MTGPPNPRQDQHFVPDEIPTLDKVRRKYDTGLEHIKAQLKRTDVSLQEAKAKLMQVLARPENNGLELAEFANKYVDMSESYELTLLLIKEYLEGYLDSVEDTSEVTAVKELYEKSQNKQLREIGRLRVQNTELYQHYLRQQDDLQKALAAIPSRPPEAPTNLPETYELTEIEPEKNP